MVFPGPGAAPANRPNPRNIVVVGGGPAAVTAVEELRSGGFTGHATVLCGEPTGPYDRTACSQGLIEGRQRPKDIRLPVPAGAEWLIGESAVGLDPEARTVTGSSGTRFSYDGLIIATGGRVPIPDTWSLPERGVYPLRTIADALAIRQAMRCAERMVIVGGGLTGCELASRAVREVRHVVLVDPNPALLHAAVGDQVGTMITNEHRDAGVELRLGREVRQVRRNRRGRLQLLLDDETSILADLVVLATGAVPETAWLAGSGLRISDGVVCDPALRAVDADGSVLFGGSIVAAGAVARWPNPSQAAALSRIGTWAAALEQGAAAARSLLAGPGAARPVAIIPRYFSQQYHLRIQIAGGPVAGAEVRLTRVRRGAVHGPVGAGVLATYHRAGRVIAATAVNAPVAFNQVVRDHLAVEPPLPVPVGSAVPRPERPSADLTPDLTGCVA